MPDAAYFDADNRLYYVGNGGISANLQESVISIFSVDRGKLIGSIALPGNNVESMAVDNARNRLYVNIRDKKQIGVVVLKDRRLFTTWTVKLSGFSLPVAGLVSSEAEIRIIQQVGVCTSRPVESPSN